MVGVVDRQGTSSGWGGLDTALSFPSRLGGSRVCRDENCWGCLGRLSSTWGQLVFQMAGMRY